MVDNLNLPQPSPVGDEWGGVLNAAIQAMNEDVEALQADKADKATTVAAGTGLTGGGSLAANRTLAVDFAADGEVDADKAVRANDSRLVGGGGGAPEDHTHGLVDGLNAQLATSRRGAVAIVCLGSSTTAGTGATTPAKRWVNRFAGMVQESYPSGVESWEPPTRTLDAAAAAPPTLPGVHVVNGGIGGTTSASYATPAIQANVVAVAPAIIIHMVGANDYALDVPVATFQANVQGVIADLDNTVPRAVIHVLADTFARPDVDTPVAPWSDYVAAMEALADAAPNVVHLGQVAEWEAAQASGYDPVDPLRLTDWRLGSGGGIHPSDSGHDLLAAMIAKGFSLPPARGRIAPEARDRFARAVLGSTEMGQPWVVQSGGFAVSGGALTITAGGNAVVNTGFSDAEVSALMVMDTTAVPGLVAKSNDSATRIAGFLNGPSNRAEIFVGGSIKAWSPALGLVHGREYHMRLTVIGDQVTLELDGARVVGWTIDGATLATYAGYTHHGVRCGATSAVVKYRHLAVRRV